MTKHRDVIQDLLAQGIPQKVIAKTIGCSVGTVAFHKKRMYGLDPLVSKELDVVAFAADCRNGMSVIELTKKYGTSRYAVLKRRTELGLTRPKVLLSTTLQEAAAGYAGKDKYARVRNAARAQYKNLVKNGTCARCGWRYHVEVCHIKPIGAHEETDTVGYVNRMDNIILLCPNCHWLLDNMPEQFKGN